MEKKALGLIETVGMAAALEAADAAVKSANVTLIGYELSKGGGMVTIKLEGDVGAVNAAVQSGCAAANKVNRVCSSKVIPRPHEELKPMVASAETVGASRQNAETKKAVEADNAETTAVEDETKESEPTIAKPEGIELKGSETVQINQQEILEAEPVKKNGPTCKLCDDIACTRVKGDLKTKCIHYFNDQGGVRK